MRIKGRISAFRKVIPKWPERPASLAAGFRSMAIVRQNVFIVNCSVGTDGKIVRMDIAGKAAKERTGK
jgi:hypothetical protein